MKAIFVAALLVASALAQVVKKLIATTTFIDIVTTNIIWMNQDLWREDGRCGPDHPLADGSPGFLSQHFSPGILGQSSEIL